MKKFLFGASVIALVMLALLGLNTQSHWIFQLMEKSGLSDVYVSDHGDEGCEFTLFVANNSPTDTLSELARLGFEPNFAFWSGENHTAYQVWTPGLPCPGGLPSKDQKTRFNEKKVSSTSELSLAFSPVYILILLPIGAIFLFILLRRGPRFA